MPSPIIYLEAFRCICPSDCLGRDPYLVDAALNNGHGQCDCKDWDIRCEQRIKAGYRPGNRSRCKHIIRVRNYLCKRWGIGEGALQKAINEYNHKEASLRGRYRSHA